MTNIDPAIVEAVALGEAVAERLGPLIDAARAEAWDEGYAQASRDCGPYQYRETPNPYRATP